MADRTQPAQRQPARLDGRRLRSLYTALLKAHGPQHWWPADTPFEVMVGAVLTQNTAWHNASRAIAALEQAGLLAPERLAQVSERRLAELLRTSGTYRVKARRLQSLSRWLVDAGGIEALRRERTATLRARLLRVHGIGPETADAILLYAFDRPVFVVDAYTYRLFSRWGTGQAEKPPRYEPLRTAVERVFGETAAVYNELHALIVYHCKHVCRTTPRCAECVIRRSCHHARAHGASTGSRTPAR